LDAQLMTQHKDTMCRRRMIKMHEIAFISLAMKYGILITFTS